MAEQATRVDADAVRSQLERIVASAGFQRSPRSAGFLRYVVGRTLAGGAGDLKEYVIALEVFDREASYDPRVDATVRVEAGKLRVRLQKYYETDGQFDPIRIEIPKGAYVPVFQDLVGPSQEAPRREWSRRRSSCACNRPCRHCDCGIRHPRFLAQAGGRGRPRSIDGDAVWRRTARFGSG